MSITYYKPFEREPRFHTDNRTKESLLKLVRAIAQLGQPSREGSGYLEYWEQVIAERGNKQQSGRQLADLPTLDMHFQTPPMRQEGMVIAGSFSILKEVVEFPRNSHAPAAKANVYAELYEGSKDNEKCSAIVWADYEVSTAPASYAADTGGIGVTVALEITPHSLDPFTPPASIGDLWDGLSLESILPCPEEGPLPLSHFDGHAQHLQALSKLALRQWP